MKTLGNIIWCLVIGIWSALSYCIIGIILCITIIGIPFGKQCFKFANLVLTPFGKVVESDFGSHPIANIIWIVLVGWLMALENIVVGVLFCVTIIGIPFGLQCFKLAHLSFIPFGAKL